MKELTSYAERLLQDQQRFALGSESLATRMIGNLRQVGFRTAFSGVDAPIHALHALATALQLPPSCIRYLSACDVWQPSQKALRSLPPDWRPRSIEGNILDCLSPSVRLEFERTHAEYAAAAVVKGSVQQQMLRSHVKKSVQLLEPHDLRPPGEPLDGSDLNFGLQLQVVGLDCSDFSPRGSRKKTSGESLKGMLVYLVRVRQMKPHAIIVEEAVDFMHEGMALLSLVLGGFVHRGGGMDMSILIRVANLTEAQLDRVAIEARVHLSPTLDFIGPRLLDASMCVDWRRSFRRPS